MKKLVLSAVAAVTLCSSSALAADLVVKARPAPAPAPTSPWDIAFGGALLSDYNFRGISQSDRGLSATAYIETRFNANPNLQFYIASQYWAVDLPTTTSCECDFYGGVRPTIGPFAFDFGFIYYYYPKETGHGGVLGALPAGYSQPAFANGNVTYTNTDYWEVYGKVGWEIAKDRFAVGANVYYSPDWLQTGAKATFASATAKVTLPSLNMPLYGEVGWYISGEVGYYWIGNTGIDPVVWTTSVNLPDYATWNIGVAFTWKVFTLDLRYYDTDLTKEECNVLTSDPRATATGTPIPILNPIGLQSKLCSAAFIAAVKFDLLASKDLK